MRDAGLLISVTDTLCFYPVSCQKGCHSRMFLAGISKNGCPINTFGHDIMPKIPIFKKSLC